MPICGVGMCFAEFRSQLSVSWLTYSTYLVVTDSGCLSQEAEGSKLSVSGLGAPMLLDQLR